MIWCCGLLPWQVSFLTLLAKNWAGHREKPLCLYLISEVRNLLWPSSAWKVATLYGGTRSAVFEDVKFQLARETLMVGFRRSVCPFLHWTMLIPTAYFLIQFFWELDWRKRPKVHEKLDRRLLSPQLHSEVDGLSLPPAFLTKSAPLPLVESV